MILFQLLEENITTFAKEELKKNQKLLHDQECLGNENIEEEERSIKEAFLMITQHFLKKMKQNTLADILQSSKKYYG